MIRSAPGRPQDTAVTAAILDAVMADLAEHGFRGLTMDAVARRAGVGKSAIYRRWPSKVEMTADALRTLSVVVAPVPDTGSLDGDLLALLTEVRSWLDDSRIRRVYPDLLAEAQRNPVLAEALMDYVGRPRRARAQVVLDRAAERGELAATADQDLMLDALGALVFWRLIALGRPVTDAHLGRVARLVGSMAR
ncbi:AcrR family transcriptional regulator [Mycobacterium sp. OAS707]|uniref:TetR/AcrR family transcriptional regulator n=1 Tax=Mycobacterium sp. OAS707 TaxID=2663822 RepID=UPI00178BB279|nr:TetR/AcrR family transcriptional regulator [Mycobacterium sp. OAS707]MBE1546063.1 AcrR family transcriptional regulator [Mycobacterium sp. OAS707]